MENKKSEVIQIRVSKLEKQVIKDKASLLGISVTDYIINCCVFSSVSDKFMENLCNYKNKPLKTP